MELMASTTYQTYDIDEFGVDLSRLAMTDVEVARLTRNERVGRLHALQAESNTILDLAIDKLVTGQNRTLAATVALYSGGNDSTTLAHIFKDRCTHAAHANTKVGVEATRVFVRETCASWGLPLIERSAPREEDSYRYRVLGWGFPGPGSHMIVFQKLKERALEVVRNELVENPYKQRVAFLAGRRRQESARRANVPELQRKGSTVWVSPLVNWTKQDLNTYRLERAAAGDPVPRNEVSDLIHMSGECLCGCFAHEGEREEISQWFKPTFDEIAELESILATYSADHIPQYQIDFWTRQEIRYAEKLGRGSEEYAAKMAKVPTPKPIPEWAKTWGWGGDPAKLLESREKPSKTGILCSSCDARYNADHQHATVAVPV